MDAIEALDACLDQLQRIMDDTLKPTRQANIETQRLNWLERQISARIAQIQGLKLDLESGLSPQYLDYASVDDLMDFITDIQLEIQALERMAREIKSRALVR